MYTINKRKLNIVCINILITNKNPYMGPLLVEITVWEVKGAQNGKTVYILGGLGTSWKRVFYEKLTRTTTPKILSVLPLNIKEHIYKIKQKSARQFFQY